MLRLCIKRGDAEQLFISRLSSSNMLHPLIYLSALSLLAGAAAEQMITGSSELDISSCPITFYGQTYKQIYVNFTSENFAICFNDFYNPQTTGDCIVGPKAKMDYVVLSLFLADSLTEEYFISKVPTIDSRLECMAALFVEHNGTSSDLVLANFGTQAALLLLTSISDSVVIYEPGAVLVVNSSGSCFSLNCNDTAVRYIIPNTSQGTASDLQVAD
ncbi:hypothetical protein Q8A73_012563 [Channa argus]|nr:hypothetical protein Q8A73_012563 [Channa argus]